MKTTNFDISKKLAEIGFKAPYATGHLSDELKKQCLEQGCIETADFLPAYDLETILSALPKIIEGFDLKIDWEGWEDADSPRYKLFRLAYDHYNCGELMDQMCEVVSNQDESLADTAARMLLKLVEAGIVKFNN